MRQDVHFYWMLEFVEGRGCGGILQLPTTRQEFEEHVVGREINRSSFNEDIFYTFSRVSSHLKKKSEDILRRSYIWSRLNTREQKRQSKLQCSLIMRAWIDHQYCFICQEPIKLKWLIACKEYRLPDISKFSIWRIILWKYKIIDPRVCPFGPQWLARILWNKNSIHLLLHQLSLRINQYSVLE